MKAKLMREYRNDDTTRNARIEIHDNHPLNMTGGMEVGYRIIISHDCWTGAEWLPIYNDDEAFTLDDAIRIAKSARDQMGWIAV